MSEITIRQSVPFDLPAIVRIERLNESAAHWSDDAYRQLWNDPEQHRIAFVAEDRGELVGFIVGHEIAGDWELENVAVAPSAQRQGIGRALVSHLLHAAETAGGSSVFLEVRRSNVPAQMLYRSFEFELVGLRENYYRNSQEDALVFEKKLMPISMKIR